MIRSYVHHIVAMYCYVDGNDYDGDGDDMQCF